MPGVIAGLGPSSATSSRASREHHDKVGIATHRSSPRPRNPFRGEQNVVVCLAGFVQPSSFSRGSHLSVWYSHATFFCATFGQARSRQVVQVSLIWLLKEHAPDAGTCRATDDELVKVVAVRAGKPP
jgi:hypothetical protein